MSTYAPPVQARHRPHIEWRAVVIVGLVAALVALGSWVIVDRYAGGNNATENATTLIDNFYAASSAHDATALKALWTSDGVMWWNGERYSLNQLASMTADTPSLQVGRIAPVSVWGDFAATFNRVKLGGTDRAMIDVIQMKDGKIFRSWQFEIGFTPPFRNTAVPD